jgi:predicted RNase H-like nuclease (RuvC/YqgF family)
MNLIGKILTVAIFVMSLVFMAFAVAVFATHTNWKMKVTNTDPNLGPLGLKPQLDAKMAENEALGNDIEQLKNALAKERAARVNALAAAEAKLIETQRQLTQSESDLAKLQTQHQVLVETNNATQNTLTALTDEVTKLRDEIRTAQQERDNYFDQMVALTDTLNQANIEKNRLTERRDQLLAQVAAMDRVLERNGLTAETPVSHIPPRLEGVVTESAGGDMIEVSLGSDDGLKKGHFLEVIRGSNYIGRLQVVSTEPDQAVARILKPYQKGPIRRGDRVRTKID